MLKKYIKWGVWRVGLCQSYIYDARFLKFNIAYTHSSLQQSLYVMSQLTPSLDPFRNSTLM
jgi:hypothetical protein